MTPEILVLLLILGVMGALFLSEKLPFDVTAILGLFVLIMTGYITPDEAFLGFSSPAIVTMISMFFVGTALMRTGVAEAIADQVISVAGTSERVNVFAVMLIAVFLSAFMNNVAATAVLLPAVSSISRHIQIPPSRLLIPLCFGTILGGMTTLIGTTPNIIIADLMRDVESDVAPFEMLDFLPLGFAMVVLGIGFVSIFGVYLLPWRDARSQVRRHTGDLTKLYRLYERLFSLKIPDGANLQGKTLQDLNIANMLGVQVVAINRAGEKTRFPSPEQVLEAGDHLLVQGRVGRLQALLRFRGIKVAPVRETELAIVEQGLEGALLRVEAGELVGSSLREMHFRNRYGLVVAAIQRGGEFFYRNLHSQVLEEGDVLHVIGRGDVLQGLSNDTAISVISDNSIMSTKEYMFVATLPKDSELNGMRINQSALSSIGVWAIGIMRGNDVILALEGREILRSGDRLLLVGEHEQVEKLSELGTLEVQSEENEALLESQDIGVVEAVLSPRSKVIDQTLIEMNFREKYGFQVLAIWREGRPLRTNLSSFPLKLGDSLLLHGPRSKMHVLAEEGDFVLLTSQVRAVRRFEKAPYAVLGLLLMILISVFKVQPIHVSAFIAAVFVVVTGAITMEEAYKDVSWRVVFLVAALIPIKVAIQTSHTDEFVADALIGLVGGLGPWALLIVLTLCSSLISQALDGAIAVILLTPVGITAAKQMSVSPYPILMGVALGASIAFLTPFSHKANLIVMGAGGYRVVDYFRVGSFLTIILLFVLVLLIPLVYPF